MHELFVAQSLLKLSLEHAEKVSATRITTIDLLIGELASMVDDSLVFHWDIISNGTIAEGAELRFNRVPANIFCYDCSQENTLIRGQLSCPNCESDNITTVGGTEFTLQSLEVETADP